MRATICQCGCKQPIPERPNHRYRKPRYLLGHSSRDPRVKAKFADTYRRQRARPLDAPIYRCQCGCDEEIPWRPRHRKWPPRFIQMHYLRDDTTLRVRNLRLVKLGKRMTPPPDWKAPSGLCECGCGQSTQVAKFSRPERGEYIGHPRRWRVGHHAKVLLAKRGAENKAWKGGRYATRDGYILIHKPDHPGCTTRDGYVLEHRYVYEISRAITLPKDVVVHHINGIKDDNRPENLIAMTRSAHSKLHLKTAQVIALFLDDRLLEAARDYVRSVGELPDLGRLTVKVYGSA